MFTISKSFSFSASHVLEGLPEGHQCGRLHGHNYVVEIEVQAEAVDERGFVVDYGDLASFRSLIDDTFDHRHLNDILIANPTAENLAVWLFEVGGARLAEVTGDRASVSAVTVHETEKTWAEYRPRPPWAQRAWALYHTLEA